MINKNTDITFRLKNISYRLFSLDFNKFLCFKHNAHHFLYTNKKHWTIEQKERPLIKNVDL